MTNQPGIEFSDLPANSHRCIGEIVGDWIVFTCPLCAGYERRLHRVTNVMVTRGQTEFNHYGSLDNANNAAALLAMSGPN